ncbi:cysteine-rich CWC family protein [Burkholderiaceae bacterium]|nr:cysteine-rich CWC family protein [Burkholderiaceae bacterium]
MHTIDPCQCPLCGQANQCQMAAQKADSPSPVSACWCVQAVFPPTLLAQVPPAYANKACICQACLHKHEAGADIA